MIYRLIQLIEKNDGTLSVEFYIHKNKKGNLEYTLSGKRFASFQKRNLFRQKGGRAYTGAA